MIVAWRMPVFAGIAGIAAGLYLGMHMHPQPIQETPAPAVRQSDGSLVLERAPSAKATPKQIIPHGGTVERVVQVTVQPTATPLAPVTVDLTLVGMPDGSKRVVASSPDGAVTGGIDIPVVKVMGLTPKPNEAGVIVGFKTIGAYYQRAYGQFTTGVDVRRVSYQTAQAWDVSARIGYRW